MEGINIYWITILFTLLFVFYQKHQLIDTRKTKGQRDTTWKTYANLMKALFFGQFLIPVDSSVYDVLLTSAICAIVFEVGYNIIAMGQKWYFYGTSSDFDKLGYWKWLVLFIYLLICVNLKFHIMPLTIFDANLFGVPFGVYLFLPVVYAGALYFNYQSDKDAAMGPDGKVRDKIKLRVS